METNIKEQNKSEERARAYYKREQGIVTKKEIQCVNRHKYGHREIDPVTGNKIPVLKYQDSYYLCIDCIEEIKLNRWFLPVAIYISNNNEEQLQDIPGRITEGFFAEFFKELRVREEEEEEEGQGEQEKENDTQIKV